MKIDRHIPLPATPAQEAKVRVPVENMEVGDSVFFADVKRNVALGKCMGAALARGLRITFKSAVEGDGVRVWRKS